MTSEYQRSRPHPWHGLDPGLEPPASRDAYIEITPFDLVKYEIDKTSGYLRVDRAQRTSSPPPALCGSVGEPYARGRAEGVVAAALEDYREELGDDAPRRDAGHRIP